MLADLMQERGFRVGRGTYRHPNGDIIPTWVIYRPDAPAWRGIYQPWESVPEIPEEGEIQTLLELCGRAIQEWDRNSWKWDRNSWKYYFPGERINQDDFAKADPRFPDL